MGSLGKVLSRERTKNEGGGAVRTGWREQAGLYAVGDRVPRRLGCTEKCVLQAVTGMVAPAYPVVWLPLQNVTLWGCDSTQDVAHQGPHTVPSVHASVLCPLLGCHGKYCVTLAALA